MQHAFMKQACMHSHGFSRPRVIPVNCLAVVGQHLGLSIHPQSAAWELVNATHHKVKIIGASVVLKGSLDYDITPCLCC